MSKFAQTIKRSFFLTPIATIAIASVFPMQAWCHQSLILFALIWFHTFMLFDVFGK